MLAYTYLVTYICVSVCIHFLYELISKEKPKQEKHSMTLPACAISGPNPQFTKD